MLQPANPPPEVNTPASSAASFGDNCAVMDESGDDKLDDLDLETETGYTSDHVAENANFYK